MRRARVGAAPDSIVLLVFGDLSGLRIDVQFTLLAIAINVDLPTAIIELHFLERSVPCVLEFEHDFGKGLAALRWFVAGKRRAGCERKCGRHDEGKGSDWFHAVHPWLTGVVRTRNDAHQYGRLNRDAGCTRRLEAAPQIPCPQPGIRLMPTDTIADPRVVSAAVGDQMGPIAWWCRIAAATSFLLGAPPKK